MKVHHLNCGTMRPLGAPRLVCHVLLVETERVGLVLVDTGWGLADIADPAGRIGPPRHLLRPALDPEETAARQVERLGFVREDVRHIVTTHFDADHIGGLADFPHARVHATAAEIRGAVTAPSRRERVRFRPAGWAHGPLISEYGARGESWRGFAAARGLDRAIEPGLVLIPLPGHTRGHAAVAVEAGDRWILHAGDAFYHPSVLGPGPTRAPAGLRFMEAAVAHDLRRVRANQARLRELAGRGDEDLTIVCAHDAETYEKLAAV